MVIQVQLRKLPKYHLCHKLGLALAFRPFSVLIHVGPLSSSMVIVTINIYLRGITFWIPRAPYPRWGGMINFLFSLKREKVELRTVEKYQPEHCFFKLIWGSHKNDQPKGFLNLFVENKQCEKKNEKGS